MSKKPIKSSEPTEPDKSTEAEKKAPKTKKPKKESIPLPAYFDDPAMDDEGTLKIQELEAKHWLLGTGPFEKENKSYSAKITYKGPRRFMSRQVVLGKRSIAPNRGNWKVFVGSARLRQNEEYHGNIKDTQFIYDALFTEGGQKNYSIRFVQDPPLAEKEEKARFLGRDSSRVLSLPYRIRKDQIRLGLKIPLRPGEAAQILSELSEEGLPKDSKHITEYLNQLIQQEKPVSKEQKKS